MNEWIIILSGLADTFFFFASVLTLPSLRKLLCGAHSFKISCECQGNFCLRYNRFGYLTWNCCIFFFLFYLCSSLWFKVVTCKNVMSHITLHQSEFSHILIKMWCCWIVCLIKLHPQSPDEGKCIVVKSKWLILSDFCPLFKKVC